MARYTNFFMTGSSQEAIGQALVNALEACDLNLIYQDPVCIVAKERPGQVSFAQLATVELLISPPTVEQGGSKIDLVVKNEELPLRRQNHCREVFVQVNQAITDANAQQEVETNGLPGSINHSNSAHASLSQVPQEITP
jgi:hypothetical protein